MDDLDETMAFQLKCEMQGCTFIATNDDKDLMLAAFGSHQKNHDIQTNTAIAAPQRNEMSRAQRTERPKIQKGGSEETWNTFFTRWNNYKKTSGIPESVATGELFECCSLELGDDIIRENPQLLEGAEKDLLAAIKRHAIIPVAKTVRRSDVLQMRQDHDEGVRAFYARVKGKADTCAYIVTCTHNACGRKVDYTHGCTKRTTTPGLPAELPFPAVPENIPRFEEYCKTNYASSVFNQCPHQTLPEMGDSPPLKIHVDPQAEPVAHLKTGFVPLHLYDLVMADLKRDIAT